MDTRIGATAARAGLVYALIVYGFGFALGTIRVLLVVPRFGATGAVLMEAPLMLAVSWWVCRWCVHHGDVAARPAARILMGVAALFTLLAGELLLAAAVFGQSPGTYARGLASVPGAVGFGAQVAFAVFPLAQLPGRGVRTRPARSGSSSEPRNTCHFT